MISIAHSSLRATRSLSSMTLQRLRLEMRFSWGKYRLSLKHMPRPPNQMINFMPFGQLYSLLCFYALISWYRFCFEPNLSRPLLNLEERFFNEKQTGNGVFKLFIIAKSATNNITLCSSSDRNLHQIWRFGQADLWRKLGNGWEPSGCAQSVGCQISSAVEHVQVPSKSLFALGKCVQSVVLHLGMEVLTPLISEMQKDNGNHQDQVKELTEKTVDSLDNLALKMLYVSVQQNNLELCLRYAVEK